ncbi:hypothetical protein [Aeromonas veronii]|uniref:hypothetical protein n=1 Tax=Aeromonas veronii TaxID=654 RepID=UPI000D76AA05
MTQLACDLAEREEELDAKATDAHTEEVPDVPVNDDVTKGQGPHGLKKTYQGVVSKVVHCEGSFESLSIALARVMKQKRASLMRMIILQIERLASGERMSKENFPPEGDLPNQIGQSRRRSFYALKKLPIRAYCWHSDTKPKTWYISHYIYKDKDKLDTKDTKIVHKNWQRIEVNGDDS